MMKKYGRQIQSRVSQSLPLHTPYETVLDFGGGTSIATKAFRDDGKIATCYDLQDKSCLYPQWFTKGRPDSIQLPFVDNSFDLVFSHMCFHHIPSEFHFILISELYRVCKKYVVIVEEDPGRMSICRWCNGNLLYDRARYHKTKQEWEKLLHVKGKQCGSHEFSFCIVKNKNSLHL